MIPPEKNQLTDGNGEPCSETKVESIAMDEEGTLTIAIGGQIRYSSAAPLQNCLQGQLGTHKPRVLHLNLEHVTFVDSQGLAFFIALYKLCYAQQCSLALSHMHPSVLSLIRLTRMDNFVKIL